MDLVWMIANDPEMRGEVPNLLECLEGEFSYNNELYKHLLPTVGPSIVPGLVQRLRANARNEYVRTSIVKGMAATGCDLRDHVSTFMGEVDCQVRFCGMLISTHCPSALHLNLLWKQHEEMSSNPVEWRADVHSRDSYNHEQSMNALKACSVLSPEWIAEKITSLLKVPSAAAHDLVWLLVNLDSETGRKIWRDTKELLLRLVPHERQRCIAWNMRRFPDPADEEWLVIQLPREDEFLGGLALDALARINADRAVREISRVTPFILSVTRKCAFKSLLLRRPESTCQHILKLLQESPNVWRLAEVWFGNALWLDASTCRFLLETFAAELDRIVKDSETSNNVLDTPLSLLETFVTAEQLCILRKFKNTPLERNLVELVRQAGARAGADQDSLTRNAIRILSRIAGDGIVAVVEFLLSSDSVHGRFDGVQYAANGCSAKIIVQLNAILKDTRRNDGEWMPREQAAKSLIFWKEFDGLVPYFELHYPQIDHSIMHVLAAISPLPEYYVDSIRQRIEESGCNVPPGLLVLLGCGENRSDINIVRSLFDASEKGSVLAGACVLALQQLRDTSEESVPLLQRELATQNDHRVRYTLIRNKSEKAIEVLLLRLAKSFEIDTAANLLNDARSRVRAIEIVVEWLNCQESRFDYHSDVRLLIEWVQDRNTLSQILTGHVLLDTLHWESFTPEGSIRTVGWKATCIKALSLFDQDRAIEAAKRVLLNPEHKDRERFAQLLVEMDAPCAIDFLLDLINTDDSEPLQAAIGRSLASVLPKDRLLKMLQSDAKTRIAASRALGWSEDQSACFLSVQDQLGFPLAEVSDEAAHAIFRFRRIEETKNLVNALIDSKTPEARWPLIDCLIRLADLGLVDGDHPEWAQQIRPSLHPMQRQWLHDKLVDARKK